MGTDATVRRVLIVGDGINISKYVRAVLETAGREVIVVPAGNFTITGKCHTEMLFDDLDRRFTIAPIEPKAPTEQRVYGPQRKGKGGKIRRW